MDYKMGHWILEEFFFFKVKKYSRLYHRFLPLFKTSYNSEKPLIEIIKSLGFHFKEWGAP